MRETERERERGVSSTDSVSKLGLRLAEAKDFSRSLMGLSGAQALGPPSTTFLRASAGSCSGGRTAGI